MGTRRGFWLSGGALRPPESAATVRHIEFGARARRVEAVIPNPESITSA